MKTCKNRLIDLNILEDLKHRDFDATLKELDSRISKIEKNKMANEINDLMNSEGDMEFKTSTKDEVNKTAMGNDRNSSKQLNFLEKLFLNSRTASEGRRMYLCLASANHQK